MNSNSNSKAMNANPPGSGYVAVVEDDEFVRELICLLIGSLGIPVTGYVAAQDFLDDPRWPSDCRCLVLDVRLPDMSGLELQKRLVQLKRLPPTIFVTGHGEVSMAVEAMRNGAIDFLQKPFNEQHLLDSVQGALRLEKQSQHTRGINEVVAARLACLTPREHEVLAGIRRGLRTKEIATELKIATKTAEEHRSKLMRKMHAKSIADLLGMLASTP